MSPALLVEVECFVLSLNMCRPILFKGELNPKIDFSSFEHLGIVVQLYEVFLRCWPSSSKKFNVL